MHNQHLLQYLCQRYPEWIEHEDKHGRRLVHYAVSRRAVITSTVTCEGLTPRVVP